MERRRWIQDIVRSLTRYSFGYVLVMCEYEGWNISKAEHWRIDAFELLCRRVLRVPWITRGSNQSVLKEINPEYSLKGLMLKLKLHYFGQLMRQADSLDFPDAGEIESKRRGWQSVRWLDSITTLKNMNLSRLQGIVKDREDWHATVHGVTKTQTQLSNNNNKCIRYTREGKNR